LAGSVKLLASPRGDEERLIGSEMTEFELLAIPLSLILGLGITNI